MNWQFYLSDLVKQFRTIDVKYYMQIRTTLAIGSWTLFAIALGYQGGLTRISGAQPLTPQEHIENLHKGIKMALEDLTMTNLIVFKTKDSDGKEEIIRQSPKFGFSRSPTNLITHDGVVRNTLVPIPLNLSPRGSGIEYYGVSARGNVLQRGHLQIAKNFGIQRPDWHGPSQAEVLKFADQSIPAFNRKEIFEGKIDGLKAEARVLRLTRQECLPCHQDLKVGDPVGVVVYVIHDHA